MGTLVAYRLHDAVAAITIDDGRVNVLSLAMLTELDTALDRAQADRRWSPRPAGRGLADRKSVV